METLVAAANDVDVVFEQHVGVALVKAIVLTYECRASLGSMLLNFQIDLSEEIDGVGLGVLVFRIARRFSLGKYQLEMEIVLVVVIRLSGSIESEHAEVVRRSESPRKHFRVHTTGRFDHFSEERDLTLVRIPRNMRIADSDTCSSHDSFGTYRRKCTGAPYVRLHGTWNKCGSDTRSCSGTVLS